MAFGIGAVSGGGDERGELRVRHLVAHHAERADRDGAPRFVGLARGIAHLDRAGRDVDELEPGGLGPARKRQYDGGGDVGGAHFHDHSRACAGWERRAPGGWERPAPAGAADRRFRGGAGVATLAREREKGAGG